MKLSGVMLGTENAKTLAEFYTKILGEPGMHQDEWYGYDVNGGALMIGPHSDVRGANQDAPRIMIMFECDDVKAEAERIKACGATVIAEPYQPKASEQPDMWIATFADPDGNYFQLAKPWK